MTIASKIFLVLEGLFLGYLSFLGMLLIAGSSIPLLSGAITTENIVSFAVAIVIGAFLVSGWRIFFWVLIGNIDSRSEISKCWFIVSGLAVITIILNLLLNSIYDQDDSTNIWYMQSQMFMLGLFFLPTVMHMILHISIEKISHRSDQIEEVDRSES